MEGLVRHVEIRERVCSLSVGGTGSDATIDAITCALSQGTIQDCCTQQLKEIRLATFRRDCRQCLNIRCRIGAGVRNRIKSSHPEGLSQRINRRNLKPIVGLRLLVVRLAGNHVRGSKPTQSTVSMFAAVPASSVATETPKLLTKLVMIGSDVAGVTMLGSRSCPTSGLSWGPCRDPSQAAEWEACLTRGSPPRRSCDRNRES